MRDAIITIIFGLLVGLIINNAANTTKIMDGINKSNAEVIKEIKNTNQIELELIDAVNRVLAKKDIQAPDVNCEAIAEFLESMGKSRVNRNTKRNTVGVKK